LIHGKRRDAEGGVPYRVTTCASANTTIPIVGDAALGVPPLADRKVIA